MAWCRLAATLDRALAAIPGQVPVVFRSLAANLGQVAVVLAVILDQAPEANLDQVAVEFHRAQSDAWPQGEESGSVARSLAARRSEAQSRRYQEAAGVQDALEDAANLGRDDQEKAGVDEPGALAREEGLDQDGQERQAACYQDQPELLAKCCQDARLV